MNISLIPFFVAANLAVNDVDNYAPEFHFTGEIDADAFSAAERDHERMTFPLRCRPLTDSDSLSCRILEMYSDKEDVVNPSFPEGMKMPFSIKFNEKGVQAMTIPSTAQMPWLSTMKEIADTLNIGIDLNKVDQLPKVLTGTEKTLIAQIDTTFKIHTERSANLHLTPKNRTDDLNLHVIHLPEIERDTCIVIEKSRDVANSDDVKKVVETFKPDLQIAIELFNATMFIGDGGIFRCEHKLAINAVRKVENKKEIINVRRSLRLTLESVENATEEWPVPEETKTFGFYVENSPRDNYLNTF